MDKKPKGTGIFFKGIFVGITISILLVAGAVFYFTNRGLVVSLEIEELADYIGKQIESQAARELPRVVAGVKAQVPALVKNQMQRGNLTAEIKISDISIVLPSSALAQLDGYLQETVEKTLYRLLEGMELGALANDLGQQAQEMVRVSLGKELAERRALSIDTYWGRIPVVLQLGRSGEMEKELGEY